MKKEYYLPDNYKSRIENRGIIRYCLGYLIRLYNYFRFGIRRWIVRLRGGKIGRNSLVPFKLAMRANENLIIGENVSINSYKIDVRRKVVIEDNVIMNRDVEIIRLSHNYDSMEFSLKEYTPLVIESYSWLATGCKILPSCSRIAEGSVIGAFSVLYSSTEPFGVYSGFPAKKINLRKEVWKDLVVVGMNGGDWQFYRRVKRRKK